MKGIVLAGGSGTRLFPITKAISKQLLPIYNKPMIYYPISTLMLSGIRDILIISTSEDIDRYRMLLGDGSDIGVKFSYKIQKRPEGIAQALAIGEDFIGEDDVCLILGDNIFYGKIIPKLLKKIYLEVKQNNYSVIFGYDVNDPNRYGVVEFDENLKIKSLEEKPVNPKSNYAVVGLYFYKNDAIQIAKNISPSDRGELEINCVNQEFLNQDRLKIEILDSVFWLDTGTYDALAEASSFIKTVEKREGRKISCLEEIAYKYGYINEVMIKNIIKKYNNSYGEYLKSILK